MSNTATQIDAAEYWPIHIARSDGQGYANLDHKALNPDDDQDATQLERWEVIIAGHLQIQLGPKDDKKQYKLAELPKGYELRCAVRKDKGRDYYLYGHPLSSKANYRTPGEFALHVLWLVSDSTDNSQCPCELCVKYLAAGGRSESVRSQGPGFPLPASSAAAAAPTQTAPAQGPAAAPGSAPSQQQQPQQQQPQQPQQQQPQQQQPQQQQQHHQQQLQQQQPQQPQPAPPGTTSWTNVFRLGELVWYKHSAWRLGVIIAITPKQGIPTGPSSPDSHYHFTLAPLGHALLEQTSLVKDCQSMRPFLTFSVPNASMDELKDKTFDTVNWPALTARISQDPDPAKRETNRQILGLEASKMGARAINDAFSTFDLVAQGSTPDGALRAQHYRGIYLGAEMVRVGDPVRITAPDLAPPPQQSQPQPQQQQQPAADANLVMLVSEIQVLAASTPTPRQTLHFKGDLYRPVRFLPATHGVPQGAVPAESLGPAFAEEIMTRNAIEKDGGARWVWVLAAAQVVRAEQDVQGRCYVTEKLMSVIDPVRLQGWVQRGMLEEAPAYLNNRGHSGGGAYVGRKPGRKAALGQAVAVEFRVPAGMVEN